MAHTLDLQALTRRTLLLCGGLLALPSLPAQSQTTGKTQPALLPRWRSAMPLPAGQAPPMMLAQIASEPLPIPITQYWVSEKLDGVRAWWDGRQLRSRQGSPIHAPEWFTHNWPNVALDGELWAGRGRFEQTSSTIQTLQASDAQWRSIQFWAFDLPEQDLPFDERLSALQDVIQRTAHPHLKAVAQWRVHSWGELRQQLQRHVNQGAEGLMLHDGHAKHTVGRSPALLKLKPLDDAEATVLRHIPGQGKHAGKLGALEVRNAAGQTFRIGTGFSDAQRAQPPAIGSTITYSHQGLTKHGLPRFARYVRQRNDMPTLPSGSPHPVSRK